VRSSLPTILVVIKTKSPGGKNTEKQTSSHCNLQNLQMKKPNCEISKVQNSGVA